MVFVFENGMLGIHRLDILIIPTKVVFFEVIRHPVVSPS